MTEKQRPDRNLALELVRVTEAAALAASPLDGPGRQERRRRRRRRRHAPRAQHRPDGRHRRHRRGREGRGADALQRRGDRRRHAAPHATSPSTRSTAPRSPPSGRGNAIAVIAVSERGTMFDPGPCVYMEKIAVGPEAAGVIDIDAAGHREPRRPSPRPRASDVRDVTAVILDRDRHDDLIAEVRDAGARIRLIPDGDVAGAISTAWPDSGADILFGIGGTPEGVIAAAALKCMGGEIQGRLWPRNDDERQAALDAGYDLDRVLDHRRPRRRRQLLLRRHRHHRRRAAQGRALRPARGDHAVARHAVEVGHRPPDRRPATSCPSWPGSARSTSPERYRRRAARAAIRRRRRRGTGVAAPATTLLTRPGTSHARPARAAASDSAATSSADIHARSGMLAAPDAGPLLELGAGEAREHRRHA